MDRHRIARELTRLAKGLIASDLDVTTVDFESGQEPQNWEWATSFYVEFTLSGAMLAKLLGKQRRVLPQALKKTTLKELLHLLDRNTKIQDAVVKAARPSIKRLLLDHMMDEFPDAEEFTINGIELSSSDNYWLANVSRDGEAVHFGVVVDVIGEFE